MMLLASNIDFLITGHVEYMMDIAICDPFLIGCFILEVFLA
jgi:hypothetical protein